MSQMTLNRIKSKQTLNLQFYKAEKLQRSNNKLKINKDSYTVIDITRKLRERKFLRENSNKDQTAFASHYRFSEQKAIAFSKVSQILTCKGIF